MPKLVHPLSKKVLLERRDPLLARASKIILHSVTLLFVGAAWAATNASPPTTAPAVAGDKAAPPADAAAQRFLQSCAGCHTLGGGKLTGPDLITAAAWNKADLKPAIKRMEQRVGPLTEADLEQLADFVKDPTANTRLKSAEARLAQMFMAKMEPASPAVGRELFFGAKPFANGGMMCSSCHAVQGCGGSLGPDLTKIHARMGDTPLVSAIEKTGFKVMAPAYQNHPVTKQEALHLAKYLGSLDPAAPVSVPPPTGTLGFASAAALLVGLAWLKHKKGFGKRPRMERRRK